MKLTKTLYIPSLFHKRAYIVHRFIVGIKYNHYDSKIMAKKND